MNLPSPTPEPFQPRPHQSPEPFQPSPTPEPFQQYQHRRRRGKNYSKPIFGEDAEEESRSSARPSRVIYRQSTLRGFAATRAAQLVHLIYIDNLACNLILL